MIAQWIKRESSFPLSQFDWIERLDDLLHAEQTVATNWHGKKKSEARRRCQVPTFGGRRRPTVGTSPLLRAVIRDEYSHTDSESEKKKQRESP